MPRIVVIALLLAALLSVPATAADIEWDAGTTWVFIVGTLEWEDAESFEPFPKEHRRDAQLARFFREQGVPQGRLVFLMDEQATTARVTSSLERMLSQTREGDTLFFYYTGHGYQSEDGRSTYFATYDASEDEEGWSAEQIVRTINRRFRGDSVFLAVDACHSGAIVDRVRRMNNSDKSFAAFASTTSKESSTENWTFTEMLIAALRGRAFADIDNDGAVTLGELSRGVREDMRYAEEQTSASILTGHFEDDTTLAEAPRKRDRAIGRRVEVMSEGDWYKGKIVDARNGQYRIHYYGYATEQDEWVEPKQVKGMGRGR